MKKIIISAFLLSQTVILGQNGELKGKILEKDAQIPIAYATIGLWQDGQVITGELSA